jgi:hypothetical protein
MIDVVSVVDVGCDVGVGPIIPSSATLVVGIAPPPRLR